MPRSPIPSAALAWGLALLATPAPAQAPGPTRWVATWTAPADSDGPALAPMTLRQRVRVSLGGSQVRLRLSNRFGKTPLALGTLRVALEPGPGKVVTFAGSPTALIPPGGSLLSDPLALGVAPLQTLTVSLFLPKGADTATLHGFGNATVQRVPGPDATAGARLAGGTTDDSRYFLTGVEVAAAPEAGAVVVVGDSTSDGVGSTLDTDTRWPDALAERLQREPGLRQVAVVNAGIAGNRVLRAGVDPFVGESTLTRFDEDALAQAGVRWVICFQGINDITANTVLKAPEEQITPAQLIDGYRSLAARAHARGLKVAIATLLPRGGAGGSRPHTPAAETQRLAVNAWIRSSRDFDAVFDFEAAVRDPAHPDRQRPELNSGDHTHPNAAGYRALAEAVDLRFLAPHRP
ncbi:MAG TPA: SGNH/GDSL hydrolase family protein [Holophagaceae bacterium]|nr:SGNH/GDSL hydrolase family protein [Holophagaceae bacterium]